MSSIRQQRVLGVFAHPDDESIAAGTFLALAARQGHDVSVITCTRGERGEVVPAELDHLERDGEALAAHREQELTKALAELGVHRHLFLDQVPALTQSRPARFVDSGMTWVRPGLAGPAPDAGPEAFSRLDTKIAATLLAIVIRQLRPDVLITEDPHGGYGHPDHLQAHRAAMLAVELAGRREVDTPELAALAPWQVPAVAWVTQSAADARRALEQLAEHFGPAGPGAAENGQPMSILGAQDLPAMAVEPADIQAMVPARSVISEVLAALRAHASQLCVVAGVDGDGPLAGYLATSNGVITPLLDHVAVRTAPGYDAEPITTMLTTPALPPTTTPDVPAADVTRPARATTTRTVPADRLDRADRSTPAGLTGDEGPPANRIATHVLCAVLGIVVAAVGTVVHRYASGDVPVGIILALAAVLTAATTARALARGTGLFLMAGGAILTSQVMAFVRPGDDVLVTNDAISYAWLFGVPLACLLALALPRAWFAALPAARGSEPR